jgi:hypothetical protein
VQTNFTLVEFLSLTVPKRTLVGWSECAHAAIDD